MLLYQPKRGIYLSDCAGGLFRPPDVRTRLFFFFLCYYEFFLTKEPQKLSLTCEKKERSIL